MNKILHLACTDIKRVTRIINATLSSQQAGFQTDIISSSIQPFIFQDKNITNHHIPPLSSNHLIKYLHFFLCCFTYIWKHRKEYEIIHIHTMPDFLVFAALPANKIHKKIILNLHDMFPELLCDLLPNKLLFKLALFIERKAVQFSDYCIVVHQEHFNLIKDRSIHNKKTEIIFNTYNPYLFNPENLNKKTNKTKTLIYSGSSSPRFGLDVVIKAFKNLIDQNYNIKLKILTGGKTTKNLRKLIEKMNLANDITFSSEFTSYKKSLQEISISDIGIVSYRNTTFTNYVLPVKMFEYAYLGKPIITPKLRTITNYFPENSVFYYPPEDIQDLTNQIKKCLDNPDLAQQKAQKSKEIIEKYPWHQEQQKYLEIISQLTQ